MTLPPLILPGTGSFTGPFQNPSGSAGAATAATLAPDSPAALAWTIANIGPTERHKVAAATAALTIGLIRLHTSARWRTRNVKAVVKRRVATVLRNNLHLTLRVRDEPKRNHRIRAQ